MQKFFIVSTGTDIGKTYITAKLIKEAKEKGKRVMAIKPVISGFEGLRQENDISILLKAMDMEISEENANKISKIRLKKPLSPNIAADLENVEIDFQEIIKFCDNYLKNDQKYDCLFIEGAGGVMSPITYNHQYLDLIKELKDRHNDLKIILVTTDYLGAVSHTLSALTSIKSYGIDTYRIIFNIHENIRISPEQIIIRQKIFESIKSLSKMDNIIFTDSKNNIL